MKLDKRSLPSGLEIVTENPRVVRLTQGKLTSADFGVRRLRSMHIDLLAEAFEGNTVQLNGEWDAALADVLVALREEETILTLSYEGEGGAERLSALTERLKAEWGDGPYELEIRQKVISRADVEGQ